MFVEYFLQYVHHKIFICRVHGVIESNQKSNYNDTEIFSCNRLNYDCK